jgi:hypothetical protein
MFVDAPASDRVSLRSGREQRQRIPWWCPGVGGPRLRSAPDQGVGTGIFLQSLANWTFSIRLRKWHDRELASAAVRTPQDFAVHDDAGADFHPDLQVEKQLLVLGSAQSVLRDRRAIHVVLDVHCLVR